MRGRGDEPPRRDLRGRDRRRALGRVPPREARGAGRSSPSLRSRSGRDALAQMTVRPLRASDAADGRDGSIASGAAAREPSSTRGASSSSRRGARGRSSRSRRSRGGRVVGFAFARVLDGEFGGAAPVGALDAIGGPAGAGAGRGGDGAPLRAGGGSSPPWRARAAHPGRRGPSTASPRSSPPAGSGSRRGSCCERALERPVDRRVRAGRSCRSARWPSATSRPSSGSIARSPVATAPRTSRGRRTRCCSIRRYGCRSWRRCEGQFAGFLMARVDFGEFGRTEPTAVLDTIGVDPDYTRQHVGRALLEQLLLNLRSSARSTWSPSWSGTTSRSWASWRGPASPTRSGSPSTSRSPDLEGGYDHGRHSSTRDRSLRWPHRARHRRRARHRSRHRRAARPARRAGPRRGPRGRAAGGRDPLPRGRHHRRQGSDGRRRRAPVAPAPPREQRGHHPRPQPREDERRRVGVRHRREPHRRIPRAPGGGARDDGSGVRAVVNVVSINGLRGKYGQANYSASKAGLVGLTKTAARELGPKGVTVNAVAPGMVLTEMTLALAEEFRQQRARRVGAEAAAGGGGHRGRGAVPALGRRADDHRRGHPGRRRPVHLTPAAREEARWASRRSGSSAAG